VTKAVSDGIISSSIEMIILARPSFAITHFELLTYFARPYNFTPNASHPGLPYREVGIDTQSTEIDSELKKYGC
jgi:hypothetical protein